MTQQQQKVFGRIARRVSRIGRVDEKALEMALDAADPRDTERVRVTAQDGPVAFVQLLRDIASP